MYLVLYTWQQVKIQIWRFLSYGRAQISVATDWDFIFFPPKDPDAPLPHISLHNTTFFPMVISFQSLWACESFVTMESPVFSRKSSKIVSSFILLKVQNASWSLSVIALLDQGLVSFYVTLFPANYLCCILVEQLLGVSVHWRLSYTIPLSLLIWLEEMLERCHLLYIPALQSWSPGCATPKQAVYTP